MSHRLLLADDSVTIQRVIELTFADEDIDVIAVGDGREAIRRIEADRPDIVLADVGMPEKDGYEVAAYVKNTPHLSHIPVLLLTGAFEPIDEQRAQEVGCVGVLAKPFEPQIVITRVNELLESATPPRAATVPPVMVDRLLAPALAPAVEPLFDAPPVAAPSAAMPRTPPEAVLTTAPAPDLRPSGEEKSQAGLAGMPSITDNVIAAPERHVPSTDPSAIRIGRRTPIAVPGFGAPALPPPASPAAELDDYFEKLDAAFATLQQAPPKPESPGVSGAPAIAQAFSALLAAEHGQAIPAEGATVAATPSLSPEAIDQLVDRVASEVVERMSDRVVRDVVTDVVSRIAEKLVREEIDRVKATIK